MKWKNKELFSQMTPEKLKHVLESGIVTKHPGTDNEGRAIFLFRFSKFEVRNHAKIECYVRICLIRTMGHQRFFNGPSLSCILSPT